MENTFSLIQDPQMPGRAVLAENNQVKICPFIPPITLQKAPSSGIKTINNEPQFVIQYRECGTHCALFRTITKDDHVEVFQTCAHTPVCIIAQDETNKSAGEILKM